MHHRIFFRGRLWAAAAGKTVACGEVSTECSETAPGYLEPLDHHVDSVLILADGRLATASFGGIFLYSTDQCHAVARQSNPPVAHAPCAHVLDFEGWARSLLPAPTVPWLAATTETSMLRLWRVTDRAHFVIYGYGGPVDALAWRDDSTQLASSSGDECAVWPFSGLCGPAGGTPSKFKTGARINCLAFAPRGGPLAIGDERGNVYLWSSDGGGGLLSGATAEERVGALSEPIAIAGQLRAAAAAGGACSVPGSSGAIDGVVGLAWLGGREEDATVSGGGNGVRPGLRGYNAVWPRLLVCLASGYVGSCGLVPSTRGAFGLESISASG